MTNISFAFFLWRIVIIICLAFGVGSFAVGGCGGDTQTTNNDTGDDDDDDNDSSGGTAVDPENLLANIGGTHSITFTLDENSCGGGEGSSAEIDLVITQDGSGLTAEIAAETTLEFAGSINSDGVVSLTGSDSATSTKGEDTCDYDIDYEITGTAITICDTFTVTFTGISGECYSVLGGDSCYYGYSCVKEGTEGEETDIDVEGSYTIGLLSTKTTCAKSWETPSTIEVEQDGTTALSGTFEYSDTKHSFDMDISTPRNFTGSFGDESGCSMVSNIYYADENCKMTIAQTVTCSVDSSLSCSSMDTNFTEVSGDCSTYIGAETSCRQADTIICSE